MATKLHVDTWINKADPDYYMMFIKSWIPFNAWYCNEFETTKDSVGLNKTKTTNNVIRNRIEALLINTDKASLKFRFDLANLHNELINRSIINYGKKLSFTNIKLDEYYPEIKTLSKDGIIYKIIPDKNTGHRVIVVKSDNSKTFIDRTFNPYSIPKLLIDNKYIELPTEIRTTLMELYKSTDPDLPFNLLTNKDDTSAITLDVELNIHFVNNPELIAKSLIQILYELRCLLFHGTIHPNETNMAVYEYGFNILRVLIKEIK